MDLTEQCRQAMRITGGVFVSVCEPPQAPCPVCGGDKWYVQKTSPRHGKTLTHGSFEARQTVHSCAMGCQHPVGVKVTQRPTSLTRQLLPESVVGYDVMVFVGRKRFLEFRQREEICTALLDKYGITLSTGEVSNLMKRFIDYLARLHYARAEPLKAALLSDGGWPMHVDATGEHGRGTLFVVMAGWRQWVLGAFKPATEKAELLVPCMLKTVQHFGAPCAAMRDLGRAVTQAIDELMETLGVNIPVLACHQHFLADIGKDLLGSSHTTLRELFKRTGTRPKLRDLARDLGRKLGKAIEKARDAVLDWQVLAETGHRIPAGQDGIAVVRAITQWVLDYPADATGLDFPFDRPYLDLYDRCRLALRATDAFLRITPEDQNVVRALKRLHRRLAPVHSEVQFCQNSRRLRSLATLFDEMRNVLRLVAELPEGETEQEIEEMHREFNTWVALLENRRPTRGPAQHTRKAIDIILNHIEKHGENLWGHAIPLPENIGSRVRLVSRTNFLLENRFKHIKHGERRRSGRRILTQDLEHLPAESALAYNLKQDDYVSIVCGSLDRLPEAFAQMDQEEEAQRLMGNAASDMDELGKVLQISTASISTPDRRVVRTKNMNDRIRAAAGSRAPRYQN